MYLKGRLCTVLHRRLRTSSICFTSKGSPVLRGAWILVLQTNGLSKRGDVMLQRTRMCERTCCRVVVVAALFYLGAARVLGQAVEGGKFGRALKVVEGAYAAV